MDTDGPAIRRIVIDPASPIKNALQSPVTLTVTIGLNEAVADGSAPLLDYLLSGPGLTAVSIPVLTQITAEAGDAQTWQAAFQLPADAGQLQVETLQFVQSSEDNLGNAGDCVLASNHFQVYQGDLPPLAASRPRPFPADASISPGRPWMKPLATSSTARRPTNLSSPS